MTKSLDGRVAVVTGAARGIGDAIARTLADAGARVFSIDMIAPEAPRQGIADLQADVTSPASVKSAFAGLDKAAGGIDILINNAGIQRAGLIGQISFDNWMAVINTHLTGFFLCASEAVPRMVRQKRGGAIVSISSVAAFQGLPGRGPYCAAKAGILGLTRALSLEVAPVNIRVNAICPGYTQTKLIEQGLADGSIREDWMLERVPAKRLATPEEIAKAVLFLAGDDAGYITGQSITVDGGWTVQGTLHAPGWLDNTDAAGN